MVKSFPTPTLLEKNNFTLASDICFTRVDYLKRMRMGQFHFFWGDGGTFFWPNPEWILAVGGGGGGTPV